MALLMVIALLELLRPLISQLEMAEECALNTRFWQA